jgi:hypothetical protein
VDENGTIKKKVRFPIIDGKESWKKFQTQKITEEQIDWEWAQFDQCGVATGKISGITCVDLDTKDITKVPLEFFNTYVVESEKGYHFYFKYNPEVRQTQGTVKDIDLRSDGGFLFCPPTKYTLPSGKIAGYKIINNKPLAEFPIEWYRKTFTTDEERSDWKEKMTSPVEPGERNMSFASIIGGLLKRFPMDEWESVVWTTIQDKNRLQEKPLGVTELRTTYESICKAETKIRHQGGEIKDISVEVIDEDMRVNIRLEQTIVCFKIKNIISTLAEANAVTWIEKATGLSHEIPFYLKIRSDTNKEQWVRILGKAFDRKENKEIYPWTIIVSKVVSALENHIRTRQQDFIADVIESKECKWLLEPFVQEDQINTIFGMGSSGKTLLSLYFAKEIADTMGHKILFIDYEDTPGGWKSKLAKITKMGSFNPDILKKFVYFDSEQIPIAEQVDKIREVIKRQNIKLVIVDSASLATGESTSDEKSAVRLVSALKLLRTTILLIAHQRKNNGDQTPIGSIQYENQSRNVWNVSGNPDDSDNHVIHVALKHTKANNTFLRREPLGYCINYTDKEIMIHMESAIINFEEKYTILQRITKLLKNEGEFDNRGVADSLSIGLASAKNNLSAGKRKGLFENTPDGKWRIKDTIIL